jgi:hypothetical protein
MVDRTVPVGAVVLAMAVSAVAVGALVLRLFWLNRLARRSFEGWLSRAWSA